jgi:release factor glutamine methyltransferase
MSDAPWTVKRLREWTTPFLAKKGVERPSLDADLLLAHALGWKRIELHTRFEEEPPEAVRTKFRELVKQRAEGCPVEYLIGRKDFFSLEIDVTRAVLIPRADSEWLVTECLRLARPMSAPTILDVCTGSGCLAVALAKQHKTAHVTATDISPEALEVATRNVTRHAVAERLSLLEGDLFAPLPSGATFDFVVSNPPYIPTDEIATLEREVRDFEPHLALDGGPDGLTVFARLADEADQFLKPGGYLLIEIGSDQESAARERLETTGKYELGKTIHDGAGHPRVLIARRPVE